MGAVWYRFRADVRTRWKGIVGIALLVGLAGGVVLTAVAGARRTDSMLGRIERDQRLPHLFLNPNISDTSPGFMHAWNAVDRLPGVKSVSTLDGIAVTRLKPDGSPDFDWIARDVSIASEDAAFGDTIERAHLIAGRRPDPARADEVLVNDLKARQAGLHPGSKLRLGIYDVSSGGSPRLVHSGDFTVTGVVLGLDEASRSGDDPNRYNEMVFTPALWRTVATTPPLYVGKDIVLTRGDAGITDFENEVQRLFRGVTAVDGTGARGAVNMNFQEYRLTAARARRAVHPYVLALWLFAALAMLAALAVVGQVIVRSQRPLREERDRLRAMGFTQRQFRRVAVLRGLVVGAGGAAVAVVIAVAASSLMPIGPLRRIEPARGVDVDPGAIVVVALGIVGLCALAAVASMRRRRPPARSRAAGLGGGLARSGAPVPVVSGVRFAFDRGRDRAIPLQSTLFGLTVALAAIVATLVYASGLGRFTTTPVRYGWPWAFTATADQGNLAALAHKISATPEVAGSALGAYSQFEIGGRSVAAVGIDATDRVPFLPMLSGRAPTRDDEIVLGASTLRSLGRTVGDTVTVRAQGATRDFLVVGTAVFPRLAPFPASEPTGLGIGAATTAHAIGSMKAELGSPFYAITLRPGARVDRDAMARTLGDTAAVDTPVSVVGPQRPNDVLSYDRLSTTPFALAVVLVLMALASGVHLLVTSVRSRRADIALLKTFGVTRRSALGAVLVQATTLVLVALAVAVPAGVLAGRWFWIETARWLGIAADPLLPVPALVAVVAVSLVVANLVALGPATVAARIRPAVALRSE